MLLTISSANVLQDQHWNLRGTHLLLCLVSGDLNEEQKRIKCWVGSMWERKGHFLGLGFRVSDRNLDDCMVYLGMTEQHRPGVALSVVSKKTHCEVISEASQSMRAKKILQHARSRTPKRQKEQWWSNSEPLRTRSLPIPSQPSGNLHKPRGEDPQCDRWIFFYHGLGGLNVRLI